MNSKHTPGPWHLNEEGRPIGADGRPVGEMSALMPFNLEEGARISADRQLICAAWEMLDVIMKAEQQLDYGQYDVAQDILRAAITKATGETP